MCGIFGIIVTDYGSIREKSLRTAIDKLFRLSESRGKEASGLIVRADRSIHILKEPVAASRLIRSDKYKNIFSHLIKNGKPNKNNNNDPIAIFGHSRLVTNGKSELNSNNQPVVKDGAVGVHNGIIVNDSDLWKLYPSLEKKYDVDTEVFLGLLQMFRKEDGSFVNAVKNIFAQIQGSASVAVLFDDMDIALLATNTGSLYTCAGIGGKQFIFASEKYILKELIKSSLKDQFDVNGISQIKAGNGLVIDLQTMDKQAFNLNGKTDESQKNKNAGARHPGVEIIDSSSSDAAASSSFDSGLYFIKEGIKQIMMRNWERLYSGEIELKRCTKCLLPETMPYISFDEDGVCNYCRNFEHRKEHGVNLLKDADKKLVNNRGLKDYAVEMGGNINKISVIPAGVYLERFNPQMDGSEIREKHGVRKDEILLFFIGWIYEFSGMKEVAESISTMKNENIKLMILDEGFIPWISISSCYEGG